MTMKKRLLLLGLLVTGMSLTAQNVFYYGFEEPLPEGKLEYINFLEGDTRDTVSTDAHSGNYAVQLQNSNAFTGNTWERALKFRDLNIEPNTSYRVSFWVKGDNTYQNGDQNPLTNIQARMMMGEENADIPYVATGNATFGYTLQGFQPDTWTKYSMVFFYTGDEQQIAYYKSQKGDTDTLNLRHFLCLNVYNPGIFNIDDISIDKSSIKGITYNEDILRVDFGYATNLDALRNGEDYNIALLPKECVTVKKGDRTLSVRSVELQEDGFFIFLEEDVLSPMDAEEITVSFTNLADNPLLYTAALRPFSWDANSDNRVLNFENEGVMHDPYLSVSSAMFYPPLLKMAVPEHESFDLPVDTRTFTFTYNKNINCATVTATMVGPLSGTGVVNGTVVLQLQGADEFASTLTFHVPDGVMMGEGDYTITISGIESEVMIPADADDVVLYTIGSSASATIDTLIVPWTKATTPAESIPAGWRRYNEASNETLDGPLSTGGSRTKHFFDGGDFEVGLYFSSRDQQSCHFIYGYDPEYPLHLKPGRYNLSFFSAYWNTISMDGKTTFDMFLKKRESEEVVFSQEKITSFFNCNDGTHGANDNSDVVVDGAAYHEYAIYITDEDDYLLEFVHSDPSWWGVTLGGITFYSVPSSAAKYKSLLTAALRNANTVLAAADSSIYDGEAKTSLQNLVVANTNPSYTAPSQYTTAADQLTKGAETLRAYIEYVDAYYARMAAYYVNLDTARAVLERYAETKYDVLEPFSKLQVLYDQYKDLMLTDNDSLIMANDSLKFYADYMKNYVNNAIPALTYRLRLAVELAKQVGVDESKLVAAQEAITDNDAIAADLLRRIREQIHTHIALGTLNFGESWVDSTLVDSINVTCYIKNPNFYTTYKTNRLDDGAFPGWSSSVLEGTGIWTLASGNNPVVDTYVGFYNSNVDYFEQTVTGLPAGVFNIHMKTRTGRLSEGWTVDDYKDNFYCYLITNGDTMKLPLVQADYGLPSQLNTSFKNIQITDGTFTLGVYTHVLERAGYTPTVFWGDPYVSMVNKAEGYNYVGLKDVNTTKTVKEVLYYTIQGIRVPRLVKGLNIVKTVYDNGDVEVQKIMMK